VTEKSALDAAIARIGFPLVMKISRRYSAKSEVGGRPRQHCVPRARRLWLDEALMESARRHRPGAAIQGVLVGPMAKTGRRDHHRTMLDATFGPMIMVGFGWHHHGIISDVIYRPLR